MNSIRGNLRILIFVEKYLTFTISPDFPRFRLISPALLISFFTGRQYLKVSKLQVAELQLRPKIFARTWTIFYCKIKIDLNATICRTLWPALPRWDLFPSVSPDFAIWVFHCEQHSVLLKSVLCFEFQTRLVIRYFDLELLDPNI
jgi:hypothetical protein